MALADRLEKHKNRPLGRLGCRVGALFDSLDKADAEALKASLQADSGWRHSEISDALKDEGLQISAFTVGRHRRGDCRCPR